MIEDYDAMLNQTNIGANNNKFYVVQALSHGGKFYAYTRWGRVVSGTISSPYECLEFDLQGETGTNQMFGPFTSADAAIKQFKSKFKDKTKNNCKMDVSFDLNISSFSFDRGRSCELQESERKIRSDRCRG